MGRSPREEPRNRTGAAGTAGNAFPRRTMETNREVRSLRPGGEAHGGVLPPWSPGFRAAAFFVAGAFIAAHVFFLFLGLRYDRGAVEHLIQFLDPVLLRTKLLQSLWYLHIQPPLMNLFTGLVLKITPESPVLFHAIFLCTGLVFCLALLALQVRLGVRPLLAAPLSLLFALSPAFILFEHFLLYTFPCAALLTLAALALHCLLRDGRTAPLVLFFTCLFLLCGTRSLFHLGWFVFLYGALVAVGRGRRRRIILAGLVPLVLLTGVYAKNAVLFGEFTLCTFVEKNLWINTVGNMGDEKDLLIADGTLTPYSAVNRWASLDAFPPEFKVVPERFAHVPVLTMTHQFNGDVNYNHFGNIALCNAYGRDARWVLLHRPRAFLHAAALSAYRYFLPGSTLPVSPANQVVLRPFIKTYDLLWYGRLPERLPFITKFRARTGHAPRLFLILALPLLWCYGVWRACFDRATLDRATRITLGFMCLNIFMVFVLGCIFDFNETARYRFLTDAFSLTLLGVAAESLLERARPRKTIG